MNRALRTTPRISVVAVSVAAALVISACGNDDADAALASTAGADATTTLAVTSEATATAEITTTPETTATPETTVAAEPTDDAGMAQAALLQPADMGDGWQDYGADNAFPMTSELAASVPTCSSFVGSVFDDNGGSWAHTTLGRNMDIAFTSVAVFATAEEAAAMVAATASPDFDQCWSDFNEAAVVVLPFGITAAEYEVVEPPDVELGGDSTTLHALEGTITLGSSAVPDSCVCAFVQSGRTVLAFHSAAPVFSAAARREIIDAAIARIEEAVV